VVRSNHNKTEKRPEKKVFHGGNIISALMSLFGKKSLHVAMPMKLLTPYVE
jgi:hypothetical protein